LRRTAIGFEQDRRAQKLQRSSLVIDAVGSSIVSPEPPIKDGKGHVERALDAGVNVLNVTLAAHADTFERFLDQVADYLDGNYQMQMDGLSFSGPDPDNLRAFFHSSAVGHALAAKFKNDRLDQLLTQGAETTNVDQRRAIYKEAEQIILDEAPWVFSGVPPPRRPRSS
jgi:hypothetical protein